MQRRLQDDARRVPYPGIAESGCKRMSAIWAELPECEVTEPVADLGIGQ